MAIFLILFLLPLLFVMAAVYVVFQLAALLLWIAFAPLVWLSHRPTRQRVELYHYDREA